MYEVEVKVRADHAEVRDRLAARGADHLGTVTQVDTYYDAPHRDFAETDEALRVRRERTGRDEPAGEPDVVELTYKGPLIEAESKSRAEHETVVSDPAAAEAILDNLGFEPAATVRKERDRYELDGFAVTLDSVDGLEEFVEVETESSDDDVAEARDGARTVLESLRLDPDEQIRTSYLGLLLDSTPDEESPDGGSFDESSSDKESFDEHSPDEDSPDERSSDEDAPDDDPSGRDS